MEETGLPGPNHAGLSYGGVGSLSCSSLVAASTMIFETGFRFRLGRLGRESQSRRPSSEDSKRNSLFALNARGSYRDGLQV